MKSLNSSVRSDAARGRCAAGACPRVTTEGLQRGTTRTLETLKSHQQVGLPGAASSFHAPEPKCASCLTAATARTEEAGSLASRVHSPPSARGPLPSASGTSPSGAVRSSGFAESKEGGTAALGRSPISEPCPWPSHQDRDEEAASWCSGWVRTATWTRPPGSHQPRLSRQLPSRPFSGRHGHTKDGAREARPHSGSRRTSRPLQHADSPALAPTQLPACADSWRRSCLLSRPTDPAQMPPSP